MTLMWKDRKVSRNEWSHVSHRRTTFMELLWKMEEELGTNHDS